MMRHHAGANVAVVVLALSSTGCYGLLDGGYTNRASFEEAGGGSVVLRGGVGDLRNGPITFDTGGRGDVTAHGSRFAAGPSLMIIQKTGWDREWTPFGRAALWWAPVRGGHAHQDAPVAPSAELGVLFFEGLKMGASERAMWVGGLRADYWSTSDNVAGSTVLGFFFGIGLGTSVGLPHD
jgi:hypothetical protein